MIEVLFLYDYYHISLYYLKIFLILKTIKYYNKMKKLLFALLTLVPFLGIAHPGHGDHGDSGFTIIHYFLEPQHAIISLLSIAIVIFAVAKLASKKDSKESKNA